MTMIVRRCSKMDVSKDVRRGVVEEQSAEKKEQDRAYSRNHAEDQDSDFLAQQKVSGQAVQSHWTGWRVSYSSCSTVVLYL
jgi:predicted aspartyl protease